MDFSFPCVFLYVLFGKYTTQSLNEMTLKYCSTLIFKFICYSKPSTVMV